MTEHVFSRVFTSFSSKIQKLVSQNVFKMHPHPFQLFSAFLSFFQLFSVSRPSHPGPCAAVRPSYRPGYPSAPLAKATTLTQRVPSYARTEAPARARATLYSRGVKLFSGFFSFSQFFSAFLSFSQLFQLLDHIFFWRSKSRPT